MSTKTLFFKISILFIMSIFSLILPFVFFTPTTEISLLFLAFVSTFFILILKKILYPLTCLIDACHQEPHANFEDFVCPGTQEVKELAQMMKELTQSHQNMCDQKQDIFKEAAHELKSPIAILKARLSLFAQNTENDKELFIQEAKNDIENITHKLKELLFLKEIEWDMQQAKEHFNMQDQCNMMRDVFAPILEKKGLVLENNSNEDFALHVHKEALAKVMQAVFENIFYHTKNNTVITTSISKEDRTLKIFNVKGSKSDEMLFSSAIGTKIIERISDKMHYMYQTEEKGEQFITSVKFL